MISAVYSIENNINDKIYIGSAINITKRWNNHKSDLKRNKHPNRKLQNFYNKYGENSLVFNILEELNTCDLIVKEQEYINIFNPWFNIKPKAGSNLGFKHSIETKKLISQNNSNFWKGKKIPEKIKEKMRKPKSEETRAKISKYSKNRSEQHRKNLSKSLSIPVIATRINTEEIWRFNSMSEAANYFGVHSSKVSAVCNGKRNHTKGIIFKRELPTFLSFTTT